MPITLSLALKALGRNRLQASLTLSGMAIGVAMVVLVAGLGLGAQARIENTIERAGPTLITIRPGNFRPAGIAATAFDETSGGGQAQNLGGGDGEVSSIDPAMLRELLERRERLRDEAQQRTRFRSPVPPLTRDQLAGLRREVEGIRSATGSLRGNLRLEDGTDGRIRTVRLHGFERAWPEAGGWQLRRGRQLGDREHRRDAPVALVTEASAERLWPGEEALGRTVTAGGERLTVVGVVRAPELPDGFVLVPDLLVPLGLAQRLLGRTGLDRIDVRSRSVALTSATAETITETLRRLRELPEDTFEDFRVETQSTSAMPALGMDPRLAGAVRSNVGEFERESWEELARSLRRAGATFTVLLSAAAAVSLLVGGIGVMNVMLVSVTARTREIGLRMAMGARVRDVLVQFLVEAVTLASLGGCLGLLLAALGLWFVRQGLQWPAVVSPPLFLLAVLVAAITGVLFGYGPARRAARLDPVIALRSE